jgi:hypothetical protein
MKVTVGTLRRIIKEEAGRLAESMEDPYTTDQVVAFKSLDAYHEDPKKQEELRSKERIGVIAAYPSKIKRGDKGFADVRMGDSVRAVPVKAIVRKATPEETRAYDERTNANVQKMLDYYSKHSTEY